VVWEDPIQLTHGELAAALFGGLLRSSINGVDPELLYPAIQAVAKNPDGMARATLKETFENQLSEADVAKLAPDLVEAIKIRCPADTMFGAQIRMGALVALSKYHYQEAIEAGVVLAKTQGGHGSQKRTGEIMKIITGYGTAARDAIPGLEEVIVAFNEQCDRNEFPKGELNEQRIRAVQDAISVIKSATTQPELRTIGANPR
jgi:hypothetical protein